MSACIVWGGRKTRDGYGQVGERGYAHRVAYETARGPIPDGMQLDHLCRNTSCVNPDHLEPVTNRENTLRGVGPTAINARKVACHVGHAFDEANTYRINGRRSCRACNRAAVRRYAQRQSAPI